MKRLLSLTATAAAAALVAAVAGRADTRPLPTGPMPPPQAVAIASAAAGKPATIVCATWAEWAVPDDLDIDATPLGLAGYATIGGTSMTLRWDGCQGLLLLLDDPAGVKPPLATGLVIYGPEPWEQGDPTKWEALAWGYVLHEAQHLRGIANETEAECGMLAALPAVFAQLGVPPARIETLMQYALAGHEKRPPLYRTHPCPVPAPLPPPPPPPAPPAAPAPPAPQPTPAPPAPAPGPAPAPAPAPAPQPQPSPPAPLLPATPSPPAPEQPAAPVPSGPPGWSLYVLSGPVAPQTIPYLTQGLADPATLAGPAL